MIKSPEKGRVLPVAQKRRADGKRACAHYQCQARMSMVESHAEKAVKDTWQRAQKFRPPSFWLLLLLLLCLDFFLSFLIVLVAHLVFFPCLNLSCYALSVSPCSSACSFCCGCC